MSDKWKGKKEEEENQEEDEGKGEAVDWLIFSFQLRNSLENKRVCLALAHIIPLVWVFLYTT